MPSGPGTYGSKKGRPKKKKTQGYNARLDESLAARNGASSTKKQSMKARRDESKAAEKRAGKPAYSGNKSSSQGKKKKKK